MKFRSVSLLVLAGAFFAQGLVGCGDSSGAGSEPTASTTALLPLDSLPESGKLLRDLHPGDAGMDSNPNVLFHGDFEHGFDGWGWHTPGDDRVAVDSVSGGAHGGKAFLRARVTRAHLASDPYVSSQIGRELAQPVPRIYWRFHAKFVGATATPHHWVRMAAGTPGFQSDGLANTVPAGDQGFWFDLDARRGDLFAFYVYWYKMRSGRCNDGTAVPGCAGDQGTTYHYGNNFVPADQEAFPRDRWFCLEIGAQANTVGESDGSLALWRDDSLVGEYKPGAPRGRWLRDNFFTWGEYYRPDQDFEGFDFRSSPSVLFKKIVLDAYYQENTLASDAPDTQEILYDDVVVATTRIGCRRDGP
ncbi:MAG: hypothetical protein H6686_10940 [Fibrobacteria bacterium]|nr:hypothetical protein [Fibrobacteria bacterium]